MSADTTVHTTSHILPPLPYADNALEPVIPAPLSPKNEVKSKDLPGYPLYPAAEDMFQRSREESDIDPDDITKTKAPNEKPGTKNEKSFADDAFGGDLDVPGSELDAITQVCDRVEEPDHRVASEGHLERSGE